MGAIIPFMGLWCWIFSGGSSYQMGKWRTKIWTFGFFWTPYCPQKTSLSSPAPPCGNAQNRGAKVKQDTVTGRDDFYGMFRRTHIWRRLPKETCQTPRGRLGTAPIPCTTTNLLAEFFLQGKKCDFFYFFIFSESIACINFWIFISYQTEHIVAIIVLPTYFQHPCTSLTYVAENFLLRQGKNCQNKPENHQNWNLAKIALKSDKFMK